MNIVIISGNIFPHISARSFRTTELACGLAKQGHQVTLYGLLGKYDYTQFLKENPNLVVKGLGKSYFGIEDSDGHGPDILKSSIMLFLYKALIKLTYRLIDFPRCEFFFMTKKALKNEEQFDYLITVAHPYGCHWGAAYFRRYIDGNKFKYWAADCGDPMMGDKYMKRFGLFLKPIEKFWCSMVDRIVIPVEKGISGYYPEFRNKISVIPQSIDFSSIEIEEYKQNAIPTFLYSGVIYPGMRDPTNMLEYLCSLDQDFKFFAFTKGSFFDKYKEKLGKRIEARDYMPRKELIRFMSSMDFLVNLENNSQNQTPSKLIDYSLAKRPIICISTAFTEREQRILDEFLHGNYSNRFLVEGIEQYDTKNVCQEFLNLAK